MFDVRRSFSILRGLSPPGGGSSARRSGCRRPGRFRVLPVRAGVEIVEGGAHGGEGEKQDVDDGNQKPEAEPEVKGQAAQEKPQAAAEGELPPGRDQVRVVPGPGLLEFSGMWTVAGSFEPGSGTVTVVDGCADGPAVVNGDNGFYNFIITSSRGQEVKFEAGTTQTISNRFQSTGQDGMRTLLRSTAAGQAAFVCLDPGGTQMVEAIDVADNRVPDLNECQHLAPGDPSDHNSVDSGNTFGWFDNTGSGVPVPTLGRAGAAVLALLSLLLGGLAIRRLSAQT